VTMAMWMMMMIQNGQKRMFVIHAMAWASNVGVPNVALIYSRITSALSFSMIFWIMTPLFSASAW